MIWLARHGETTWNVAGRYQGRRESELTSRGEQQAIALAAAFSAGGTVGAPTPQRVVSSPMIRCTATAAVTALRFALELETDDRLIEIAHGTWDGRYKDEIARNDADRYRAWRADPAHVQFEGGESLRGVLSRWRSFSHDLARETRNTLVVTHDAVIRCALVDLKGLTLDEFWSVHVENGAYATFATDGKRLKLVNECTTTHLRDTRADVARQAL